MSLFFFLLCVVLKSFAMFPKIASWCTQKLNEKPLLAIVSNWRRRRRLLNMLSRMLAVVANRHLIRFAHCEQHFANEWERLRITTNTIKIDERPKMDLRWRRQLHENSIRLLIFSDEDLLYCLWRQTKMNYFTGQFGWLHCCFFSSFVGILTIL